MEMLIQAPIILLIMANFRLLGSSRIKACVQATAMQAVAVSVMPLLFHSDGMGFRFIAFFVLTVSIKAVVVPMLLNKAARDAGVKKVVEPFIGFTTSMLVGGVLFGVSHALSAPLQSAHIPGGSMLLPGSFFTIMTGLLIIVSRRKALMQVVGYLCMENGIYAFGAALAIQEPMLVEMGALLDLFVGVFVMGIAIYQISREFDHIDTDKLSELKD